MKLSLPIRVLGEVQSPLQHRQQTTFAFIKSEGDISALLQNAGAIETHSESTHTPSLVVPFPWT